MRLLIETQYLPSIAYFQLIQKFENKITLEYCENFEKQSFRNRTNILTANGSYSLSVPVEKANSKVLISEVKIDYSQRWQQVHIRAIQSAYGKSPFFEQYFEDISQIISKQHSLLINLNHELLQYVCKRLKIRLDVTFSEEYIKGEETENCQFVDARSLIHPKKDNFCHKLTQDLSVQPYQQVFGENFVPNLSILDLLFNEGPAAKQYLA